MEFKVGDKFKSINDKLTHFTKGNVYEVEEVGEPGNFHIAFKDDTGNVSWGSLESLLEHFKSIDEPQVDQSEPQTQVTKVTLTQEQARALGTARKLSFSTVMYHLTDAGFTQNERLFPLNDLDVEVVARALLIGYEVEQTAEEKVLAAWVKHDWDVPRREKEHHDAYYSGFRKGMKFVLDAYGIKVKGINDKEE